MTFWRSWVGLRWQLAADPRAGKGACCFRTAQAVTEILGREWPADKMDAWYAAAKAGQWEALRLDWDRMTEPIDEPEPGALARFDRLGGRFGIGVLPECETLIAIREHGRLVAGPASVYASFRLCRLK